jgi:cell surface protein SprA
LALIFNVLARLIFFCLVAILVWQSGITHGGTYNRPRFSPPDTIPNDSTPLPYPIPDKDPFSDKNDRSIYFSNPKNYTEHVEYDTETNQYYFQRKLGDSLELGPPIPMTFQEYLEYDLDRSIRQYWRERSDATSGSKGGGLIPQINVGGEAFENIFGSNAIDIRPQGAAELIFGVNHTRRDDPALDVKQRRQANFDFQEKIQMNVTAKIGDKIELAANYNTEATFEFENKTKLEYVGKEDEIIKRIEAGNVTMPLSGSLITGSQALFGIKTQLQFGRTMVTTVFSQQKSQSSTIEVSGGAQTSRFELKADQYEENKHFFVAQYFREHYEQALASLPIVSTAINITKIEVFVTSIGPALNESRNIIGFSDLGELNPGNPYWMPNPAYSNPQNESNNLYTLVNNSTVRDINSVSSYLSSPTFGLVSGVDFEKVENARRLGPNEYTFNSRLGFISLNSRLSSDEVLAVAFQYTIIGDTTTYQVGDFSTGGISAPQALIVKLLKGTAVNTNQPMWDLMMKNVYSIGAYQINPQDFRLDVLYASDENGVPMGYLTEGAISGVSLLQVMNLDRLNTQLDPVSDGVFDFIDNATTQGGTIMSSNGRIFFPVLEPFGSHIVNKLGDAQLAEKYAFTALYDSTKSTAQQYPEKNKFYLQGVYKSSSSSDISLNAMNVPQGSVTVTAGGIKLTENVDYTVDYTLGRVKIINEGVLNSGNPIKISLESNSLFALQTKTMVGTRIEHLVTKDFTVGATILNLTERPMTQKINIGEDPISNTIWGLDGAYSTESRLLTKLVDKIPFINTKEISRVSFTGEFAHLIPGHSKAIGKTGTSYIDDFEGSKSSIDIKNIGSWKLASTPQGQTSPDMFPEGSLFDSLPYGYNRARLAWYNVDRVFSDYNSQTPSHIKDDLEQQSSHLVREVLETEVFPNADPANGQPMNISILNLAFYPEEKGPYNYDVDASPFSAGMNSSGLLNNPYSRWGGVMRKVETTDFEATNVEYIEFWMMDPFVYANGENGTPLHSGGYVYFNLGDISEDILRDGRKSYENGLPTSAAITNVDTTSWGRVPTQQALVNSFDNNPSARPFQDVGIDGLSTADEILFFDDAYLAKIASSANLGATSLAYSKALEDPSTDNYHFYLGTDYDNLQMGILERYKYYNGPDGNSPTSDQSPEDYPTQATTLPDVEDINRDNTLSETERYYQYRVYLHPTEMEVGKNFITDVQTATVQLKNKSTASIKWYQFKIPINEPDAVIGNIQDFKSIRFIRTFFKGWNEPIVLRLATLELVRSDWRKYNRSLLTYGDYVPDECSPSFELSAVNIEENGKRSPIPYVLPPDIEREIAWGSTTLQRLNEQSLVLKSCNLCDGDARAVYKTTDFDIRQYHRLKMYVHAEMHPSADLSYTFNKGDVTVFIRLGTDFTGNYYEYEIPLTPTQAGATDPNDIWPEANAFNILLSKLLDAKQERNILIRDPASGITLSTPYSVYDGENKITVTGMPNLSAVKTIMVGIRNPRMNAQSSGDDGQAKCVEIWINELRLTDFDNRGGWAALGRLSANLADLGTVSMAANISTPGFGSLEQKLDERSKEDVIGYDFATNLELSKFFPERVGLRIPMHFDYSEGFRNPEYNPLDPDIFFKDALKSFDNKEDRDSIKRMSQDYTQRKSINFVNVKKMKTGKAKPRFYDISNWDFTYAFTEQFKRNIEFEYNTQKTYRGSIGYNFANNPKNYSPFSKLKFLSNKHLALFRDFNFFIMPKLMTFRTDMDRQTSETLIRNTSVAKLILIPTTVKTFTWNRIYSLKFDITKSLKLDFDANMNARIDEPYGIVHKEDDDWAAYKDTIMQNIYELGRPTLYNHTSAVNYNLPLNKIPLLNWVTVNARYSADYRWSAAPLSAMQMGNTIENNNTKQLNGQLNMITLYNKVGFLKKLNQQQQKPPPKKPVNPDDDEAAEEQEFKDVSYKKENVKLKAGVPKTIIHDLGINVVTVSATLKDGRSIKVKHNVVNDASIRVTADSTYSGVTITVSGKKPKGKGIGTFALESFLRLCTSLKNASFTYSQTNGTFLPGFMVQPQLLGQDWTKMAPGTDFLFGSQRDIRPDAVANGWLSTDTMLNNAFARRYAETFNARVTLEPFKNFRIEVTANRNYTRNRQEYFKADAEGNFDSFSPTETGNFTISYFAMKTSFAKTDKEHISEVFENFKQSRLEIANRLAAKNPNYDGTQTLDSVSGQMFPTGYGATSQDVIIAAFLAAYSGKGGSSFDMKTFPTIPMPNWRITYDGLARLKFFKKHFKTFTLGHGYRCTYNVGSFKTNVLFRDADMDGFTAVRDAINNFVPQNEIGQVSISEQFSPLINIDATWHSSLLTKIEYKRTRDLALSMTNNQLTEVFGSEFIIGLGYRIKDVQFAIKSGGETKNLKSDLNVISNISVRTNKTVLRKLVENENQVSSGQRIVSINTSADYMINQRFTIRVFFDKIITNPFVSSQFYNSNTNAGVSVKFTLAP